MLVRPRKLLDNLEACPQLLPPAPRRDFMPKMATLREFQSHYLILFPSNSRACLGPTPERKRYGRSDLPAAVARGVGRVKALLDTNILIDYLNGIDAAHEELGRYETVLISTISWMEVMVGVDEADEAIVRGFLSRFVQVPLTGAVAEKAVAIRRQTRIRLPDAIIWASAKGEDALLVSRNSRDFPVDAPGVRMPYSV